MNNIQLTPQQLKENIETHFKNSNISLYEIKEASISKTDSINEKEITSIGIKAFFNECVSIDFNYKIKNEIFTVNDLSGTFSIDKLTPILVEIQRFLKELKL